MKMSEEFPSKYLKAADLQGREVRVTMQNVEREKIGDDFKPVIYFKGKDKGVVLNKTNAGTIVDAYGDDSQDWFDQPLILFSVMVDFQGKVGPAIRCRVPTAKDNKQPPRRAEPREDPISSGPASLSADLDDSITFAAEFR
jgi:hypothetical protein